MDTSSFDVRSVCPIRDISPYGKDDHTLFNTGDALPILEWVGRVFPPRSQSSSALEDILRESLGALRLTADPVCRLPTASSSKLINRLCALWMMKYNRI